MTISKGNDVGTNNQPWDTLLSPRKKDWGDRTTFSEDYDGGKIVLTLEQWEISSLVTLSLEGLQFSALFPSQRSGTTL